MTLDGIFRPMNEEDFSIQHILLHYMRSHSMIILSDIFTRQILL